MKNAKSTFRMLAWAAHAVAALTLALLCFYAPAMTLFCVVPGALVGCAGVAAAPKRPVALYVVFGLLMGYGFWMGVSGINQREFLGLILILVLEVGVVWSLQQPSWPAALFTGIVVLVLIGFTLLQFRHRPELGSADLALIRRSATTGLVILSLGLVYLVLGTAEVMWQQHHKEKRARRAARARDEHAE